MKLNRLETHDRLLHFKKDQEINIFKGAEDCLKKNADSLFYQDRSPYVYLFAHPRTAEDGVNKRMLWQPRLTKPEPQINSYLFRATSHTDIIEVCWLLPEREMWAQYQKGKVTENDLVLWSINQYINNRIELGRKHVEDLSEERASKILEDLISFVKWEKTLNSSGIKQDFLAVS
jgi:hypothetical protein